MRIWEGFLGCVRWCGDKLLGIWGIDGKGKEMLNL